MIGLILCGHGNFATGLYSSLKLIAGEQENFGVIDFVEDMSSEELEAQLVKVLRDTDSSSGVVIFTDIPGGTPFRQSALISSRNEKVKVVAGTNLPMILGSSFSRHLNLEEFTKKALKTAQDGLLLYEQKTSSHIDNEMNGI